MADARSRAGAPGSRDGPAITGAPDSTDAPAATYAPAWELLLALCRIGAADRDELPAGLCSETLLHPGHGQEVDWDWIVRLASLHGVTGLVSEALTRCPELEVPGALRETLISEHRAIARANLRLSALLHSLLDAFDGEGLPVIPIKGPTLASRAYQNVALRTFSDLDLLVGGRNVAAGRAVIEGRGLSLDPSLEGVPDRMLLRWARQLPFYTELGDLVELHWDLSTPTWHLRMESGGMWERASERDWMGRPVLALSPEDQLHLLCTHPCRHGWSRLVWVCDVAQTIRSEPVQWEELLQRARESGTLRMVSLGLRLAKELLHAPVPEHVERQISRDRALPHLVEQVARVLSGGHVPAFSEFLFHARVRDRVRDRLWFPVATLLTPTLEDLRLRDGRLRAATPLVRRLMRPVRLGTKYWKLRRQVGGWAASDE